MERRRKKKDKAGVKWGKIEEEKNKKEEKEEHQKWGRKNVKHRREKTITRIARERERQRERGESSKCVWKNASKKILTKGEEINITFSKAYE